MDHKTRTFAEVVQFAETIAICKGHTPQGPKWANGAITKHTVLLHCANCSAAFHAQVSSERVWVVYVASILIGECRPGSVAVDLVAYDRIWDAIETALNTTVSIETGEPARPARRAGQERRIMDSEQRGSQP